jgi:mycothiol conjugate amidase Mca
MDERLSLLSVHAHPDDEASKGAGTVAKYHAAGVHTVLVTCTGGEEGDILNPAMDTAEVRADIGAVRARELEAAVAIIGYDELVLLGYRDSGMPDSAANAHAESFAAAPLEEAIGRLVAEIRRARPQVIVTYGDDHTGYPHPDHIRVHDISVAAFDASGEPDAFPDAGEPYEPLKLYYTVWSKRRVVATHEKFIELGLESPFDARWLDRPGEHGLRGRAPGSVARPRHAGGPHFEVLVRTASRSAKDNPSVRRLRVGEKPGGVRPTGIRPVRGRAGSGRSLKGVPDALDGREAPSRT